MVGTEVWQVNDPGLTQHEQCAGTIYLFVTRGRRRAGGQASRRGHRTVAAAKGTRKRTTDDAINDFIDNC
ncbi:jg14520 [Pararge aegeria aegeria]|uniref:Jg14520 protein n=1 Tax=Pararge aegeria aegeria TaxID=348720 RepID=A0A8S4RW94_9NEOP|nr:jg14520 [Pararge aegeria aegeria]